MKFHRHGEQFSKRGFVFFTAVFISVSVVGGFAAGRFFTQVKYNPDQRVPAWAEELARRIPGFFGDDRYPRLAIKDLPNKYQKAEVVGKVTLVQDEPDGDIHVVLADGPYRVVGEIIPELKLAPPKEGDIIIARGLVWFDEDHNWWELHPLVSWEQLKP